MSLLVHCSSLEDPGNKVVHWLGYDHMFILLSRLLIEIEQRVCTSALLDLSLLSKSSWIYFTCSSLEQEKKLGNMILL